MWNTPNHQYAGKRNGTNSILQRCRKISKQTASSVGITYAKAGFESAGNSHYGAAFLQSGIFSQSHHNVRLSNTMKSNTDIEELS